MAAGGAGAVAGAVGGPGRALAGAAAGIMVDMSVNKLHGLIHRDEFVKEFNVVLCATERQCVLTLTSELEREVEEWVNTTKRRCVVQLLRDDQSHLLTTIR